MVVTKLNLFPAGCHQKADEHDSEADGDVPGADGGNWPPGARDVVHQNPRQTQQHQAEHHRLEPRGVVVGLFIRRAGR